MGFHRRFDPSQSCKPLQNDKTVLRKAAKHQIRHKMVFRKLVEHHFTRETRFRRSAEH